MKIYKCPKCKSLNLKIDDSGTVSNFNSNLVVKFFCKDCNHRSETIGKVVWSTEGVDVDEMKLPIINSFDGKYNFADNVIEYGDVKISVESLINFSEILDDAQCNFDDITIDSFYFDKDNIKEILEYINAYNLQN